MSPPRAPADLRVSPGKPLPLGATPNERGTLFSAFSRHATSVSLLFFDDPRARRPVREIELDPRRHRTGDVWHVQVDGVGPGALYLWRVDGPREPERGHRFDPDRPLLDPYVKAVTGGFAWNLLDLGSMPKAIVVSDDFDWEGDRPLNRPLRTSVIYETHVRGYTRHPSSGVEHPGTFRGLAEKASYLRDLGVTAVELLPVQEFGDLEDRRTDPRTGERLRNYWGYNTVAFFAPHGRYSSSGALGQQVTEFKEMVRALHRAGLEVILDVVFNHTAESDEHGPTLCFRGWDNAVYYLLAEDRQRYENFSGCGNTLNANHPVVRTLIVDCLRYWVVEMHVDGFRFDLGSVLSRDGRGRLVEHPPLLERLCEDPVLRDTKLIAEAWDAAGAYQVGAFPGGRWAEWNDRFRDDVRRFWRGEAGTVGALATRVAGSSDLYLRSGRKPFHSINFVTSHDGFTLNDLVSYSRRHNEDNGEGGNDGADQNWSDNHGTEGPTDDPAIEAVRSRQVRNFLGTLLFSLGTPMILGGDEVRRTQRGNNNPWCHDSELSWLDWRLADRHADLRRFLRLAIAFRLRHPCFLRPEFFNGTDGNRNALPDVTWLAADGRPHPWAPDSRTLAVLVDGREVSGSAGPGGADLLLIFHADPADRDIVLPPLPPGRTGWQRAIDTGLAPPHDIAETGAEHPVPGSRYAMRGRSLVVLLAR